MKTLEKNIRINELLDKYIELLTPHQYECMNLYYCMDYSLNEISKMLHISRNAVYDTIKKATAQMEKLEEKLQLLKKDQALEEFLETKFPGQGQEILAELRSFIEGMK